MVQIPAPMLASPGEPPGPSSSWSRELKLDGQRAIAHVPATGPSRFWSRSVREITDHYPDLSIALRDAAGRHTDLIVDGEIVALSPSGVPDFGRLQLRMNATPTPRRLAAVAVVYAVFDIMQLDGQPTTDLPYWQRRELLEGLNLATGRIQVPPRWGTDMDPQQLLRAAIESGNEGIVSKANQSTYRPGRSRLWVKTVARQSISALIAGWIPSQTADMVGSLILAVPGSTGRNRYIGTVGTGFTHRDRRVLRETLGQLAHIDSREFDSVPTPVADAGHFIDTFLIVDIEYREISRSGHLRHPSFRGLRTDLTIEDLKWPI